MSSRWCPVAVVVGFVFFPLVVKPQIVPLERITPQYSAELVVKPQNLPIQKTVWLVTQAAFEKSVQQVFAAAYQTEVSIVYAPGSTIIVEVPQDLLMTLMWQLRYENQGLGAYSVHLDPQDAWQAVASPARTLALQGVFAEYSIDNPTAAHAMLSLIEEPYVRETIINLSSFRNRRSSSQYGVDAVLQLKEQWASYASGRSDVSVELYEHEEWPQPSLIATMPGSHFPDEVLVLGGHVDSTAFFLRAPGADDNASGVASLTESLRVAVAANYRPQRTVKWIAFAAEEVGLRGSQEIAQEHKDLGVDVIGAMNLDMTNFNGSASDINLIDDFTNADQNQFLGDLITTYLPDLSWAYTACGYGCSDHVSWTNQGYPASYPMEAQMGEHNKSIHTRNDTIEQSGNNALHATKFSRVAAVYIAELAKGSIAGGQNLPPLADAGDDQNVVVGTLVTLDGSASYDPEMSALDYHWTQVDGPAVTLTDPLVAQPSFSAPVVSQPSLITFELVVHDGELDSAPDQVDITIQPPQQNEPPTADAGPDQTAQAGALVTLDGSTSFDPEGDAITYSWIQTSGPQVSLSDPNAVRPTFVAPEVSSDTRLIFQLTTNDGQLNSEPDTVQVVIENVDLIAYCESSGGRQRYVWISRVQLGDIDNTTGASRYSDYTGLSTVLGKGVSHPIGLTGRSSSGSKYWRVWIDLNRDGDFEDPQEQVYERTSASAVIGSVAIPSQAATGPTRMRVSMKYYGYADSCSRFVFGEVEDYSVTLAD